jgi:DNA-binding cell septation regulator SpoVG
MNIRVEEIRKLERGSLRGFATVNVGDFIRISHIKIIQPEGKEPFIQMPQRSYQTNDGGRRYSNVIDLPDDLTREVEKSVLCFWNNQRHMTTPKDEHGAQSA